jgi:hypothetical protein
MANQAVICTYRVQAQHEARFVELLWQHWRTLRELALVVEETSAVYRSVDSPPTYVDVFTWVEGGFDRAHEHPDLLAVWEAMEPLLEERGGLPRWDFPHYERVVLGG